MDSVVSIIMPFFNMQTYLKESIESVLAQDYPHYELILINDGSTDNSTQIARDYAQQFKQIKLIELAQNRGSFEARRTGVANIEKGDYVLFVDADDLIQPHTLSTLVSEMAAGVDMIQFPLWIEAKRLYFPNFEGNFIQEAQDCSSGIVSSQALLSAYHRKVLMINWSTAGNFYRRHLLDHAYQALAQTQLIPEHYCYSEDCVLFVALIQKVKSAKFLPESLYFYRYTPKKRSFAYAGKCIKQIRLSIKIIQKLAAQSQDPLYQSFCHTVISNLTRNDRCFFQNTRHPNSLMRFLHKIRSRLKRWGLSGYLIIQDFKTND